MTREQKAEIRHENGYGAIEVGERVIEIPGLKTSDNLSDVLRKKEARGVVSRLHDMEKDVIARVTPGKLILYVGAASLLGSAVAGAVYLRKKRKS